MGIDKKTVKTFYQSASKNRNNFMKTQAILSAMTQLHLSYTSDYDGPDLNVVPFTSILVVIKVGYLPYSSSNTKVATDYANFFEECPAFLI